MLYIDMYGLPVWRTIQIAWGKNHLRFSSLPPGRLNINRTYASFFRQQCILNHNRKESSSKSWSWFWKIMSKELPPSGASTHVYMSHNAPNTDRGTCRRSRKHWCSRQPTEAHVHGGSPPSRTAHPHLLQLKTCLWIIKNPLWCWSLCRPAVN